MVKVPDRWFEYKSINKPLQDIPIIAFKTPLSTKFHRPPGDVSNDEFVEDYQQFTPAQLHKHLEKDGFQLIAIVDLTFTFRYYDGSKFHREFGVHYHKVKCAGQQIPNDNVMNNVAEIISNVLLHHDEEKNKLIGLHCTHGVNRTGYIICRYLIEWLGYEPEKAIEVFNTSRGHDLERENYLEDLKKREPKKRFELWKLEKEKNPTDQGEENAAKVQKEEDLYRRHNWDEPRRVFENDAAFSSDKADWKDLKSFGEDWNHREREPHSDHHRDVDGRNNYRAHDDNRHHHNRDYDRRTHYHHNRRHQNYSGYNYRKDDRNESDGYNRSTRYGDRRYFDCQSSSQRYHEALSRGDGDRRGNDDGRGDDGRRGNDDGREDDDRRGDDGRRGNDDGREVDGRRRDDDRRRHKDKQY